MSFIDPQNPFTEMQRKHYQGIAPHWDGED